MINRFSSVRLLLFVVVSTLILGCESDEIPARVGEDFIPDPSSVVYVDTFSVRLKTMLLDSIPTSNKGRVLVGKAVDNPYLGVTSVSSQMHLKLESSISNLDPDARVDSLVLRLHYDGYYHGDTLNTLNEIEVYELTGLIEPRDLWPDKENPTLFYNNTPIIYERGNLLAKEAFLPRPSSSFHSIHMDRELGQYLYDKARVWPDSIETVSNFVNEIFHGIALVPGEQSGNTIGFKPGGTASADPETGISAGVEMIIFYTNRVGSENEISFSIYREDLQYNYFNSDRSASVISELGPSNFIPSEDTDENVMVQGGTGVGVQIDFSRMDAMHQYGLGTIAYAELALRVKHGTFEKDITTLPSSLTINILNEKDEYQQVLTDLSDVYPVVGILNRNLLDEEDTEYTFDVTNYVRDEFDAMKDVETTLQIEMPSGNLYNSVDRIIFESAEENIYTELRLYYVVAESN